MIRAWRSFLIWTALAATGVPAAAAQPGASAGFSRTVQPFLAAYCNGCHGGEKPMAQFDLSAYKSASAVVRDYAHWTTVLERLKGATMPPPTAKQPPPGERGKVVAWIEAALRAEARRTAGDPGPVLVRRLSNAEYNYTVRDLTGVDIRPTREFPIDPANPSGFDNSGESLSMSPALLNKYLQAAREVANHMVLKPDGIGFAPHLMLVETDRDKYCVNRIIGFYQRQNTEYAAYFHAAWLYKHRLALGDSSATLASVAAGRGLSSKYLTTIWRALEVSREQVGPLAKLQAMWRALPAPKRNQQGLATDGAARMRDYVVALRKKIEPRFDALSVKGINATAQPFLMWKNRQYASHRMSYDRARLGSGDPDLSVPAGQTDRYEAAFARFSAIFPDAFYVSERGRNYLDQTKDRGRYLSAGFHNLMGYFRDDTPLYELMLDRDRQRELDHLWNELDFVASANIRTFVQFYFNESGEARGNGRESEGERPADKEVTSEEMVRKVEGHYLARAEASGNAVAVQAVKEHFERVNDGIRWVERARAEAEPRHLEALLKFAGRAYRRPLEEAERAGLLAYYRKLREQDSLSHEEALRDSLVSVLMSPDFSYRLDQLPSESAAAKGLAVEPLSDTALASRLSYFLWSSMPDEQLLAGAATGRLHTPQVLLAQARRMARDPRVLGLVTEFGGNWLDFRRFETHTAVDRERFPMFNDELRQAMYEEPLRYLDDLIRSDRSVLDLLYGKYTFVNKALARHYGMPMPQSAENGWTRVGTASVQGRGGILPMAVFLTQNAPGLRTSPVKRGYWVVRRVLGEQIPPPPATVPELPRDEAKLNLPLRQTLERHRQDPSCAACHARFDSLGLALESYGPVGERRAADLAGRPVDTAVAFPGGAGGEGLDGLLAYIRASRQDDFVDNLCRKLLAYALGRGLILSDEPALETMKRKLAAGGFRFQSLVDSIVTSPQFLNKRIEPSLQKEGN